MNINTLKLKIKLKSLAAEAKIIRFHERKIKPYIKEGDNNIKPEDVIARADYERGVLRGHRIYLVRKEARDSHIAYGYLRNKAYKQIENSTDNPPNIKNITKIINKFQGYWGNKEVLESTVKEWMEQDYQVPLKLQA